MDKAPSLLCLEWEYFRSLLQRTRLCFWEQQKVLHSFSVKNSIFCQLVLYAMLFSRELKCSQLCVRKHI